jgi:hypothetical protein
MDLSEYRMPIKMKVIVNDVVKSTTHEIEVNQFLNDNAVISIETKIVQPSHGGDHRIYTPDLVTIILYSEIGK